uniref:Uncharacterized protein n=1 Tax=Ralstonia solanacearum TaxID=305 RepID=A0A0S4TPG1_RALSL|nr:protein of unknown function [Ralstonia solanacearum]
MRPTPKETGTLLASSRFGNWPVLPEVLRAVLHIPVDAGDALRSGAQATGRLRDWNSPHIFNGCSWGRCSLSAGK